MTSRTAGVPTLDLRIFSVSRKSWGSQKRINAGAAASRSPLIALARTYPALRARAQPAPPDLIIPLFHADATRAALPTIQYAAARATVAQNTIFARPYGECGNGASGVVKTSMQTRLFPKGSTARRRVDRVVSSRLRPQGIVAEKAKGPAGIGQYVPSVELIAGKGDGGRIV